MILSRRARELSLSVLLFAVPVVLLYGNLGRPSQLNTVDRVVLRVSGGIQRVIVGAVGAVVGAWEHYVWLRDLDDKNAALRSRNLELRENNEILKAWAGQGRSLERELGFRVTPALSTRAADVVARGVSPYYQVLKIHVRSSKVRIRPGQAVVVPDGVVGRILRGSGSYADVLLLDDAQSRAKVTVKRTGSRGELHGLGSGGRMRGRIEYLSPRDEVRVGDLLVTSGMAGRYPRDLRLARVTGIRKRIRGRYQVVDARAVVDANKSPTVYLATTHAPKPRRAKRGKRSRR